MSACGGQYGAGIARRNTTIALGTRIGHDTDGTVFAVSADGAVIGGGGRHKMSYKVATAYLRDHGGSV